MSFVRKSIAPRSGVGTEITSAKILDDYYGFNRLLELKQGAMGDSLWDSVEANVLLGKKFGKTGGITGTGTLALTLLAEFAATNLSTSWVNKINAVPPSCSKVLIVAVMGTTGDYDSFLIAEYPVGTTRINLSCTGTHETKEGSIILDYQAGETVRVKVRAGTENYPGYCGGAVYYY